MKNSYLYPFYRLVASKYDFDNYASKGSTVYPVRKYHRNMHALQAGAFPSLPPPPPPMAGMYQHVFAHQKGLWNPKTLYHMTKPWTPLTLKHLQMKKNTKNFWVFFFFFSSTGQRPASYCHGVVPVLGPSVCSSVHGSINFAFKKLLLRNY